MLDKDVRACRDLDRGAAVLRRQQGRAWAVPLLCPCCRCGVVPVANRGALGTRCGAAKLAVKLVLEGEGGYDDEFCGCPAPAQPCWPAVLPEQTF